MRLRHMLQNPRVRVVGICVSVLLALSVVLLGFGPISNFTSGLAHGAGVPVASEDVVRMQTLGDGGLLTKERFYTPDVYINRLGEIPDSRAISGDVVEWKFCPSGRSHCDPWQVNLLRPRVFTAIDGGSQRVVGMAAPGIRCQTPPRNTVEEDFREFPTVGDQLYGKTGGNVIRSVTLQPGRAWLCQ